LGSLAKSSRPLGQVWLNAHPLLGVNDIINNSVFL